MVNISSAGKNVVSFSVGLKLGVSPHKTFSLEDADQKERKTDQHCVRSDNGLKKINERYDQ